MGWDSAPPTAEELQQKPAAWDAAPPTPEELGGKSLKGFGKNVISDATGMMKGAIDQLGDGAQLPEPLALPFEIAKAAKMAKTIVKDPKATVDAITAPIKHPVDFAYEHPIQQTLNAVGITGGALSLAEKAAPAIADVAETASNSMGRRAAGFTKALIKGKNFGNANEAVQWMIDKKIMTSGASADDMLSGVSAAKDEAWTNMSKAMEEQNAGAKGALGPKAKPQLREQFLFDPNKAVDAMEELRPKANNGKVLTGGQYDQMNAQIDDAISTIKAHGERPIPWDEANTLKGNIHANWDTTKSNAVNSLKKRIYGALNDNMETQMDVAAQSRGGNIDAFKAAKRDYGMAKTAEKALDNARSSRSGNKTISLTDTIAGVGGATIHGGLGAAASIAAKKFLERFGLTTGATMAQKISVLASKAPKLLGPYAPIMQKAMAAGGAELALTHAVLAKSDPNYRTFISNLAAN